MEFLSFLFQSSSSFRLTSSFQSSSSLKTSSFFLQASFCLEASFFLQASSFLQVFLVLKDIFSKTFLLLDLPFQYQTFSRSSFCKFSRYSFVLHIFLIFQIYFFFHDFQCTNCMYSISVFCIKVCKCDLL